MERRRWTDVPRSRRLQSGLPRLRRDRSPRRRRQHDHGTASRAGWPDNGHQHDIQLRRRVRSRTRRDARWNRPCPPRPRRAVCRGRSLALVGPRSRAQSICVNDQRPAARRRSRQRRSDDGKLGSDSERRRRGLAHEDDRGQRRSDDSCGFGRRIRMSTSDSPVSFLA